MPIDLPPPSNVIQHVGDHVTSSSSWQPTEAVITRLEKERPGFIFRENQLPPLQLPEVLRSHDGSLATTAAEWETRVRPETLEQFRHVVFGQSPSVPAGFKIESVSEDRYALKGAAIHQTFRVVVPVPGPEKTFSFEYSVFTPTSAAGKVPLFLLLNNRGVNAADPERATLSSFWPVEMLIARGYGTAVLHLPDVQPDRPDGLSAGIIAALPVDAEKGEHWGTLAAWAWAASRVLDGLQSSPSVDATRVAVIGHSRGGKTALWAGATDSRFAMVIANCSGCGGAALSRRPFGETVARINEVFPHWFCENFKGFGSDTTRLPIDQHQLLATILPRALYIGCADEDLWADPRGEFIALTAASAVAPLYGQPALDADQLPQINQSLVAGKLGYHVRSGGHDLTDWDWQQYVAFADGVWKRH
ncbi:MAG: hypothetical protein JWM57_2153 [Phycisphaerales bacterium]|nr:hypothetical protein [Phycisphaerales bacterium]